MSLQKMVAELLDSGLTQGALAKQVDTTQPTIFRILNGAEPRFSVGKRIEDLHREKIGPPELQGQM